MYIPSVSMYMRGFITHAHRRLAMPRAVLIFFNYRDLQNIPPNTHHKLNYSTWTTLPSTTVVTNHTLSLPTLTLSLSLSL
jgi:hypothetical protein